MHHHIIIYTIIHPSLMSVYTICMEQGSEVMRYNRREWGNYQELL